VLQVRARRVWGLLERLNKGRGGCSLSTRTSVTCGYFEQVESKWELRLESQEVSRSWTLVESARIAICDMAERKQVSRVTRRT